MLLMFTICAVLVRPIASSNCWVKKKGACTFTRYVLSKSLTDISLKGLLTSVAALFISMLTSLVLSFTRLAALKTASISIKSADTNCNLAWLIFILSGFELRAITWALFSKKKLISSFPIPRDAPVITTVMFLRYLYNRLQR